MLYTGRKFDKPVPGRTEIEVTRSRGSLFALSPRNAASSSKRPHAARMRRHGSPYAFTVAT